MKTKHGILAAFILLMMASFSVAAALADVGLDTAQNQSDVSNDFIVIRTSMGDITLEMESARSPVTVANFLSYVDKDGYSNTIFHRVVESFVIQGGGLLADLSEVESGVGIVNEADNGLKNRVGTITMARFSEIDSAVRQFFINVNDNSSLDHSEASCTRENEKKRQQALERGLYKPKTCRTYGYTVFGHVVEGMDVVRKIEMVPTQPQGEHDSVPLETITILKIERVKR